jgi:class 3 adenylate cyclase/tetratricopeptide (TPR) repeat protein
VRSTRAGEGRPADEASIDELLDRAVAAINRGDRAAATALAGQVLAADSANAEAEDLLAAPSDPGEIRRLTIFFADLVDSTLLSTRVEPETYRLLVGRYREQVLRAVTRYEGHIGSTKGDGVLAVFGYPIAHEDDVRRAVHAGLEITQEVARLSDQARRRFGIEINVRVGVHRGLVYLDTAQDDVYGLAANLAARVSGLAPPGAVVVSDAVEVLIRNNFELEARPAALVKGVEEPITHYRVVAERASAHKSGHGPLVGRDRELAQLEKSWVRAQAGTLSTPGVVFRGEPGIGKSRLAAAAAQLAEASASVVVELVGSPFHTDAGLHPVRALLERRCGIDRSTDQAQRLRLLDAEVRACGLDPRSTVPLLAPVVGIDAAAGYEQVAAEGRRLYELIAQAVQTYLLACLGGGAGLVVAEDLHWFDPSTREVLSALLDAAAGQVLVVMTGRPGEWLPTGCPVTVFDLAPLTKEQTDELITALNPRLTADKRAAVAVRCDGVPFYIEHVLAELAAGNGRVPEALYEPLFARLRASANAVPVVEAAATIGRHVDRSLLCSVCTLDEDEVDKVVDDLVAASVLQPSGIGSWRFRHELLREVAAELAPPSTRRGLHARAAEALIAISGDGDPDWRLVAAHYEQAERFNEAASAFHQAAVEAARRGALHEARGYLTQALAGLDHATPGPQRDRLEMALRLRRGSLTAAAVGRGAYLEDFERCLKLGGSDLANDELIATLVAVVGYYQTRGDLRRCMQLLESLRVGLGDGRKWFRRVIEANIAIVAWLRGEFTDAATGLETATASVSPAAHQIDAVRHSDTIAAAHMHLAMTHAVRGDLASAEGEFAKTAQRLEQIALPQRAFSQAHAWFMESWMRIEASQLDRASDLAIGILDLSERYDLDTMRLNGTAQQATLSALTALADGPESAALAHHIATMTALLDTLRTRGVNLYRSYFDGVLGRLLLAAGQPEAARKCLDTALALAQDTGMCFYDAELLRLRAWTRDEPGARQADINAALELARRQGATLFELRAALDDFELRGEPASAAVADAAKRIPANNAWPELARAQAAHSEQSQRI